MSHWDCHWAHVFWKEACGSMTSAMHFNTKMTFRHMDLVCTTLFIIDYHCLLCKSWMEGLDRGNLYAMKGVVVGRLSPLCCPSFSHAKTNSSQRKKESHAKYSTQKNKYVTKKTKKRKWEGWGDPLWWWLMVGCEHGHACIWWVWTNMGTYNCMGWPWILIHIHMCIGSW